MSHAAIVARQLGKPCLVACPGLRIDREGRRCAFGERWFKEGDYLSLDGATGQVYAGRQPTVAAEPSLALSRVAAWQAQAAVASSRAAGPGGESKPERER